MAKKGWKRPPMTKERFKNQFLNIVGNPFNVIVLTYGYSCRTGTIGRST